jgi:phosphoglycerol transferase MdoB-like AlkP superfamily enzyme
MSVEAISAASFMIVFVGYVRQYNSVNSQPDVLNSLYSPLQPAALEGLRYFHNLTETLFLVFMKTLLYLATLYCKWQMFLQFSSLTSFFLLETQIP